MRTHLRRVNCYFDKHRIMYKVQFTRYRHVLCPYLRCSLSFVLIHVVLCTLFLYFFEINQKIIRFRLDFPLKKRIFAMLSEEISVLLLRFSTTTLTLYRYDTNTTPLARMICTAFTAFQSERLHDEISARWKSNCHS